MVALEVVFDLHSYDKLNSHLFIRALNIKFWVLFSGIVV